MMLAIVVLFVVLSLLDTHNSLIKVAMAQLQMDVDVPAAEPLPAQQEEGGELQSPEHHLKESVDDALKTPILGLNKDSMKQYVEFVADFFLIKLGLNPLYKVANPLSFMSNIGINNKTNFFEARVGDYQLSKVMDKAKNRVSGVKDTTGVFSIEDDF